jgi:hypothetical protein
MKKRNLSCYACFATSIQRYPEYESHERRYTAIELHKKNVAEGFREIKSTSFITTLLSTMMISRFFQKKVVSKHVDASAELRISPWLNIFFPLLLSAEKALLKIGISFPVGRSGLVIAQKL